MVLKQYERDIAIEAMKRLNGINRNELIFFRDNIEDFLETVVDDMGRKLKVTESASHYVSKMIDRRLKS